MTDLPSARPVVLITGAARRVGATIARTLHGAGYDLALHHRNSGDELAALVDDLEQARGAGTLTLQAELADVDALPDLVNETVRRFGRLDGLVNNASAFFPTPLGTVTTEQWDELFASNTRAPFFLAQAAARHLRDRAGAIVNLLDIYAERPLPGYSVYCMAKAAQAAMTLALAHELGPEVRVNGIAPGAVLWPETGHAQASRSDIIARTPLKRTGTAEDVASAVLWLLRDARFVTGQVIRVDGGRSISV
ncbi:MAG: pteridine reductase [Dokdonella sp.]|uniref:pteridine reductase n=1 Tax=Dokdonella sp. TaxID=2291710 RepID=UPI002C162126|nr:pteridine reductase [Dokdonella sp.]HOX72031.1 pteridine reductase [Dokdonella sp.]HPG94590.1 pteridine reductase [Dokdonella sp.]HPN79784.1 pteridine reductase [Dokdonella sp.]